jgi:molybdopterin-guanine dinucleotide biosynthesis protein A
VLTALQHSQAEFAVVCTVDMPALRAEHLRWMAGRLLDRPQLDGMMMRRCDGGEVLVEPFPFACRKAAADAIAAQLGSPRRPVHSLLALPQFAAEDAPPGWPPRIWTNLNTPQDYEAFLNEMHHPSH